MVFMVTPGLRLGAPLRWKPKYRTLLTTAPVQDGRCHSAISHNRPAEDVRLVTNASREENDGKKTTNIVYAGRRRQWTA
jgi:hypothetical protein